MIATRNSIRSFITAHRRALTVGAVWCIILLLAFGAFALSRLVKSRAYGAAAAVVSGNSVVHDISLYPDHADPQAIKVKVGDTVRFVANDSNIHDISTRRGSGPNAEPRLISGDFGAGESYELIFQDVGTFEFYDRHHLDTTVLIVVEK